MIKPAIVLRRLCTANALCLALVIGICSPAAVQADRTSQSDSAGTIKIGFVASLTGVTADQGRDARDGMELYLDQIKHQVAGKNIQVIVENDEGSPVTAMDKVFKLTNEDHCQILDGFILGNVGYAVLPIIEKTGTPTVFAVAASDDITQRKRSPWIVRTGYSSSQPMHPFGEWAYKQLGYKRIVCVSMDYPFGWEVVGGFQKSFEEAGGKVIQKVWLPLGFQDFRQFLSKIDKSADALFILGVGVPASIIPKELKELGWQKPIIGAGTGYDESVLPHLGKEVVGVVNVLPYSATLSTPENQQFFQRFRHKYMRTSSWFAEAGYTSMMVIARAIESLHGDVSDKEKVMKALKSVELANAPRGPLKIDDFGSPVENIYVRRVEDVDGVLQNKVIATFKNVGQFWHWSPEEFLKQPVYSKDYPACKYCSEPKP